jgi:UDP-sugar transporter A1/2/3
MLLLSLQFGMQPTLTRNFTPDGICRSTVILMQEILKFVFASFMLTISGSKKEAITGWNAKTWFTIAFLPAALYAVQNFAALQAYQNLDALTFNVLNREFDVVSANYVLLYSLIS